MCKGVLTKEAQLQWAGNLRAVGRLGQNHRKDSASTRPTFPKWVEPAIDPGSQWSPF